MAGIDPYSILGVASDAPDFVVQAAYRACIKRFHPDHYKGADARQRTADILEAYRLIGSTEARAAYDRSHQANESKQAPPPPPPAAPPKPAPGPEVKPTSRSVTLPAWLVLALVGVPLAVVTLSTKFSGGTVPEPTSPTSTSPVAPLEIDQPVTATQAPPPEMLPVLDSTLQFTKPRDCEMAAGTDRLFDRLIIFDPPDYIGRRGPPVKVEGFPAPVVPTHNRTIDTSDGRNVRDNEATLAIAGTWHGLRVSKIRVRALEQSSFQEQQIRFLEPASKVRAKLNELGFDIPPIGEFRETTEGDDVVSAGIGVEEVPGGSALYCGTSIYY